MPHAPGDTRRGSWVTNTAQLQSRSSTTSPPTITTSTTSTSSTSTSAVLPTVADPGSGSSDYDDSDSVPDSDSDSSSSSSSLRPWSSSSLLQPTCLYPPFYNRPPTPLPPSPSLTSLLLPHRSSANASGFGFPSLSAPASPRHTPLQSPEQSPSASDTESTANHLDDHPYHYHYQSHPYLRHHHHHHQYHHHDQLRDDHHDHDDAQISSSTLGATDSSLAFSSHFASQTPRAAPKVPTYEYYGFVLYLVSSLAFLIYILWSYLPAQALHAVGIHYYPSRWWSLALPSWLVVAVMWIYVALAGYNTEYLTKKLCAVEIVVDEAAKIAVAQGGSRALGVEVGVGMAVRPGEAGGGGRAGRRDWKRLWNKGTDGVIDIPIGGVCEVLYGEGRELEDWEVNEEITPHGTPAAPGGSPDRPPGRRGDNDRRGPPPLLLLDGAATEHGHPMEAIWPTRNGTITRGGSRGDGAKSGQKNRKKGPKHHGGNVKR